MKYLSGCFLAAACLLIGFLMSCGRSDPIPCTDTCQNPGDTRCDGVVLQVCSKTDRHCTQWQDWVDCSYYDQVCKESGGGAECSKTCSDNCAAEGDTRCDGTVVQICALGERGCLGWVSGTDCSVFGEVCDVTQGQAHCTVVCEHECDAIGTTGCGGTFILTCAVNYYGCFYWKFGRDCADEGLICDDSGGYATCGPCTPDCSGRQCGPDGCEGTCLPGCGSGEICNEATGQCECVPICQGRECGPDGCGGTCPPGCDVGEECNETTGQCECVPNCAGKMCGPDGCGSTCPPGCGAGEQCNETTGQCECVPICQGRECGPDMCGGICPPGCDVGEECNETTGQCECVPNCTGMACGPDGCGGSCPPGCQDDEICVGGTCQQDPSALIWVEIPGGSFMMGSENGDDDERPVHRVDVPTFEMTKTEVTVEQYKACVDASVCTVPDEYPANPYCNWGKPDRLDHPMNCVNWNQAGAFCRWSGVRLPTEAQWEYAARSGGEDIEYPWGDETATCQYTVMDEGGDGCGMDRTWAVCGKTAGNTAHGLCDMSGNVYEWVRDQYHDSYVGAPTDGSAWEDLWFGDRVSRGNCFKCSGSNGLRTSFRAFFSNPPTVAEIMGIRCARPIEP